MLEKYWFECVTLSCKTTLSKGHEAAAHQGRLSSCQIGGYRHSGSGDIMVFVCHVTFQDHVIKALNDFMVRNHSRYVIILPGLVAIVTVIV